MTFVLATRFDLMYDGNQAPPLMWRLGGASIKV